MQKKIFLFNFHILLPLEGLLNMFFLYYTTVFIIILSFSFSVLSLSRLIVICMLYTMLLFQLKLKYRIFNCSHFFAVDQDWGVQQKKANRSSEKNKKKLSAVVVESRLTNDISPESTPGAGRRRVRTPHSFPHIKYTTQMSVPDQTELDKLRQRINFTDLDEVKSSCTLNM